MLGYHDIEGDIEDRDYSAGKQDQCTVGIS